MKIKQGLSSLLFNIINTFIIISASLLIIIPIINVVAVSFSSNVASETTGLILIPKEFSFDGYKYIWTHLNLLQPLFNTVFVSFTGTFLHILLSSIGAYVLIKKDMPFRSVLTSFILLTMTIPSELTLVSLYAVNREFGLLNSYGGLIINGMSSGFSVLLMRNYFLDVPDSLAEAATIDGAKELEIFFKIYMPLSIPALLTIGTLQFIARWNNISTVVTLITDRNKITLPIALRNIIFETSGAVSGSAYTFMNAKMAVVVTAVPIVLLYFLVQKYFVTGSLSGSVKE